jgi:hypothetical protein
VPIHDISLNGNSANNKHSLNWSIIADEAIRSQVLEVSTDGIIFKPLSALNISVKSYSYVPYNNSTLYYRLKVISVIDQTAYSNIVALKATGKPDKLFSVSTLVHDEITVNASENYHFLLTDASGRMISTGTGVKGTNKINVNNKPAGLYIIQLFINNEKQTERIIKQ